MSIKLEGKKFTDYVEDSEIADKSELKNGNFFNIVSLNTTKKLPAEIVGVEFEFLDSQKKYVEEYNGTIYVPGGSYRVCYIEANCEYSLYAKSETILSGSSVTVFLFYENGELISLKCTPQELYNGYTFKHFTKQRIDLRTSAAGANVLFKISRVDGFAKEKDFNDLKSDCEVVLNQVSDVYVYNDVVKLPSSSGYTTNLATLDVGVKYKIYVKSENLLSYTGKQSVIGFSYTGAFRTIQLTAEDLHNGNTSEFTPTLITKMSVANLQTDENITIQVSKNDDFVKCSEYVKEAIASKVWAAYGDSVFQISNGNGLNLGWALYVNKEIPFSNFYGRSVGGQGCCYATKGGAATIVKKDDGRIVTYYNGTSKEEYTGSVPEDCNLCRSAFCSWDRITNVFPASIKDSINFVCIMCGLNDHGTTITTDMSFVSGSTDDIEWANSGADYYGKFNGDYNINASFRGAIASMVMKMQLWMPNAVIVLCTPINGRGTTGQTSTDLTSNEDIQKVAIVKDMAVKLGLPCIDVFGTCGINPLNRTKYISDGIHPYLEDGKKMLARAMVMGLKNVEPMY